MSFDTFRDFEASLQASRERRKKPNVNKNVLKKFIMSTESHNRNQEEQEMWMRHFASKEAVNTSASSDEESSDTSDIRRRKLKKKKGRTNGKKRNISVESTELKRKRIKVISEDNTSSSSSHESGETRKKLRKKKSRNGHLRKSKKKLIHGSEKSPESSSSHEESYEKKTRKSKRRKKTNRERQSPTDSSSSDEESYEKKMRKSKKRKKSNRERQSPIKKKRNNDSDSSSSSSASEYHARQRHKKKGIKKEEKQSLTRKKKKKERCKSSSSSSSEENYKRKTRKLYRDHSSSDFESGMHHEDPFVVTSAVDASKNLRWGHDGYRELYGDSDDLKTRTRTWGKSSHDSSNKYRAEERCFDSDSGRLVGPSVDEFLESKNLKWGHDGYRELYGDSGESRSRSRLQGKSDQNGYHKSRGYKNFDIEYCSGDAAKRSSSIQRDNKRNRNVKKNLYGTDIRGQNQTEYLKKSTMSSKQRERDSNGSLDSSSESSLTSDSDDEIRPSKTARKKKSRKKYEWVEK